jgi:hypothetical protein
MKKLNLRMYSVAIALFATLMISNSCTFDLTGDSLPDVYVDVYLDITLVNSGTKDAYLVLTENNEANNSTTLVKPTNSRFLTYSVALLKGVKTETSFSVMFRAQINAETYTGVHTIDYTKFQLVVPTFGNPSCKVKLRAVFDGAKFTFTATQ